MKLEYERVKRFVLGQAEVHDGSLWRGHITGMEQNEQTTVLHLGWSCQWSRTARGWVRSSRTAITIPATDIMSVSEVEKALRIYCGNWRVLLYQHGDNRAVSKAQISW